MASDDQKTLAKLQRRYPGLEFIDRGKNGRYPWLRFQAHHIVSERVSQPAIPRVRGAIDQVISYRKLVAFGSTAEDVGLTLAKA